MANDNNLLTYGDVERITGVPRTTWRVWVHLQRVPHVRFGPRTVRFRRAEIERWIAEHAVAAG